MGSEMCIRDRWNDLDADLTTMRHAVDAMDVVTAKQLLTKLVAGFSNGDANQ